MRLRSSLPMPPLLRPPSPALSRFLLLTRSCLLRCVQLMASRSGLWAGTDPLCTNLLAAARRASCLRGLAGGFSAYGSIFLEVIVEEGSSSEVRPRELEPMRCTARASAECRSNALTASLCELIWRDFFSRPQELQGRLTEAILECVLLAGSSVRRCARVDSRRAV